ncbi:M48 family metallopeptidase [Streptomyces coeruleoprunus]|uniref:M48 family metallopeptidase n=1 Tax=Streptomyces coeruleoprunus TaxID=285563 RepID=A0ABV9XC04_9ACTN
MPVLPDPDGRDRVLLSDDAVLDVDGLPLHVRVSPRRKRLGLTVERGGSLILRVPEGCDPERAETFVRDSRQWIERKLRLGAERRQLHPTRSLRDGEIHRYLGRDYPLLLVDEPDAAVRLVAGRFQLSSTVAGDPREARKAMAAWYCGAGQRWVRGRLQPWAARMDVGEPTVRVRDLGHRWGTYRANQGVAAESGQIALHWAVFQLPIHLVDYVIAHELAHMRVAGHGPAYWRLLSRALPEAREMKEELDELGRRVWMGDVDDR